VETIIPAGRVAGILIPEAIKPKPLIQNTTYKEILHRENV
jgi:hypothetical protein